MGKISMDSLTDRGKTEVSDKLKEGVAEIRKKGEDFEVVKDGLLEVPDELEDELAALVQNIETSGRAEAQRDIEDTKRSVIDVAKTAGESIRSEVADKLADNATAKSSVEGIRSPYGREAIAKAKAALDANTRKGEALQEQIAADAQAADQAVQSVVDNL